MSESFLNGTKKHVFPEDAPRDEGLCIYGLEMSSRQEEIDTILNTHCRKIKIENDRAERRDEILFFTERRQVVTKFNCYMKSYLDLIS